MLHVLETQQLALHAKLGRYLTLITLASPVVLLIIKFLCKVFARHVNYLAHSAKERLIVVLNARGIIFYTMLLVFNIALLNLEQITSPNSVFMKV